MPLGKRNTCLTSFCGALMINHSNPKILPEINCLIFPKRAWPCIPEKSLPLLKRKRYSNDYEWASSQRNRKWFSISWLFSWNFFLLLQDSASRIGSDTIFCVWDGVIFRKFFHWTSYWYVYWIGLLVITFSTHLTSPSPSHLCVTKVFLINQMPRRMAKKQPKIGLKYWRSLIRSTSSQMGKGYSKMSVFIVKSLFAKDRLGLLVLWLFDWLIY